MHGLLALLPLLPILALAQPTINDVKRLELWREVEKREIDYAALAAIHHHGKKRDLKHGRRSVGKRQTSCTVNNLAKAPSSASAAASSSTASPAATTTTAKAQAQAQTTQGQTQAPTSAATSTTTTAAAASSTASQSGGGGGGGSGSTSNGTPNGIKAGIAGGDAYDAVEAHIGWWYDWTPNPSGHSGTPVAVPMLWGDGGLGGDNDDASRLSAFEAITSNPPYIIGFEEPDCSTEGSANMGVSAAAAVWDSVIAPHAAGGSMLISPSMCHQADETWLTPFEQAISTPWAVTNLHINKNSMAGVQLDLDYYYNKYGKPMWVTEFACVDDSNGFTPCTDQGEINSFINSIVDLFEGDSRVLAYGYSNGEGLGDVWPMWNGGLTQSGQTYLNAISKYH